MEEFNKNYYKIKEVAEMLDVPQSTLRFWEKEFPIIKPTRSRSNIRYYKPADIETLRIIHYLIKTKGLKIDAAKAQYIRFFDRYTPFLKQNGYVITDNLDFHGLVAHPEKTKNKNTKDLVRKISRFRQYLSEREDYDTTFYTFGDGVAISKKL